MEYHRRILDEEMPSLPAITLEGAGETATASRRATNALTLSDPRTRTSLAGDYDLVADLGPPLLADEWQPEHQASTPG